MEACVRALDKGWLYGITDEYSLHEPRDFVHFGLLRNLSDLNKLFPERGWINVGTTFSLPCLQNSKIPPPSKNHIEQINRAALDEERRFGNFVSFVPEVALSRLNRSRPFANKLETTEGYQERLDLISTYLDMKAADLFADTDVLDILTGLAISETSSILVNNDCVQLEGLRATIRLRLPTPEFNEYIDVDGCYRRASDLLDPKAVLKMRRI